MAGRARELIRHTTGPGVMLAAGLMLSFCPGVAAQGRGQQRPTAQPVPGMNSPTMAPTGSITVLVNDQSGAALTQLPSGSISISSTMPGAETLGYQAQPVAEGWEFSNLIPGAQYTVSVDVPGYRSEEQFVTLPAATDASERVEFYLWPAGGPRGALNAAGGTILAPRAQKEVQQGVRDLAARKIESAQKHLGKALAMAPGNALVNYLMGESWLRANKTDEAIPYLEKAASLDPKQTQALVALGNVRYQRGETGKAIEALKQAVESAPESWEAHWLLGAALLRSGEFQQAREEAESTLKYGKGKADQAELVLAVALANLGQREKALESLNDFDMRHAGDPRPGAIRKAMAEAARPAQATLPSPATNRETASGPPPPAAPAPSVAALPSVVAAAAASPAPAPAGEGWMPADVDDEKPATISNATCDLPRVLKRAGEHAVEFVTDLQQFSATEDFEEAQIGRNGNLGVPVDQKFTYLVFVQEVRPGVLSVQEMRTPAPLAKEPLMTTGTAALALVFDPEFTGDFAWKCEGMGEWNGQPAWMLHFQQRPDRGTSALYGFVTRGKDYRLALRGRAWVAANGDQVLHLETDLAAPQPELELEREHFAIDYSLVRFRTHAASLWLPSVADSYYRYRGRTYHQYSRFSDFQLFWVGTAQKIGEPKQHAPKP